MASLVSEEPEIPKHLQCPITLSLMRNPVTASDGQTYEKEAIEKWMEGHDNFLRLQESLLQALTLIL